MLPCPSSGIASLFFYFILFCDRRRSENEKKITKLRDHELPSKLKISRDLTLPKKVSDIISEKSLL